MTREPAPCTTCGIGWTDEHGTCDEPRCVPAEPTPCICNWCVQRRAGRASVNNVLTIDEAPGVVQHS